MTEKHYWALVVSLPLLALAALTGYATGAGCYAWTMNCFSVVVPEDSVTRALFQTAAFLPFGLPAYAPIALGGLASLRRWGVSGLRRLLWLAPPVYVALLHGGCVVFASWVMPERRVEPTLRFDALALAFGFAYAGLGVLASRALVRPKRETLHWALRR
ncbi:MAG: hypothetical protein ACHQ6T_12835 [Myxococcota bacterium]